MSFSRSFMPEMARPSLAIGDQRDLRKRQGAVAQYLYAWRDFWGTVHLRWAEARTGGSHGGKRSCRILFDDLVSELGKSRQALLDMFNAICLRLSQAHDQLR